MGLLRHSGALLLALLAIPIGAVALLLRPQWSRGLAERLGAPATRARGGIWLHGASAGEAQAAASLAGELARRGHAVHLSATTESGREMLARRNPKASHSLAPLDHPWCVAAALDRVRPSALVLVEGELWPAWIAAAERRQIPVALVSGRVSPRSHARYRRTSLFWSRTFARLAAVGARCDEDALRIVDLGAPRGRVRVTGDLKLDGAQEAPEAPQEVVAAIQAACVVAGSTHPGEEATIARALQHVTAQGGELCAVIAPRRLERVPEVDRELRALGIRTFLRSKLRAGDRLQSGEVLILDTLGELAGVYRVGLRAFVGGTLAPVGGHNLVEPLHAGSPVIFGPHVESAREAAVLLLESGAGEQVEGADSVAAVLQRDLADEDGRRERVTSGLARLAQHRGSIERSADLVEAIQRSRSATADSVRHAERASR